MRQDMNGEGNTDRKREGDRRRLDAKTAADRLIKRGPWPLVVWSRNDSSENVAAIVQDTMRQRQRQITRQRLIRITAEDKEKEEDNYKENENDIQEEGGEREG